MRISDAERRTIRRALYVLLPVAFFSFVVRPYLGALTTAKDRLEAERDALARERGAVAMAEKNPAIQQLTDSVLQVTLPRLFTGSDDVMASSELGAYLGEMADVHRVYLQDATTRPVTTSASGVRTVRVDIRAESDFQGLLEFLRALEQGEKLVKIERLDVSLGLSGPGNEDAETLSIVATITGVALPNNMAVGPLATTGGPR